MTGKTKPCTWIGINVWIAGRGEMGSYNASTQVTQAKTKRPNSDLDKAFIDADQGQQYKNTDTTLVAATDGSVGRDEDGNDVMGAGYCFQDNEIPSGAAQVDGEAASLRAEAAAM